jgi:uncharacterized protein (TIGR02271 family)
MDVTEWLGRGVAEPGGAPYARLDELFVGRESGRPTFGIVALADGDGERRVVVPLHDARPDGAVLALPLDRERVLTAPAVRADVSEIPPEAGQYVLEHFGLAGAGDDATTRRMEPVAPRTASADDEGAELTLSEEQLVVDTVPRAAERVRVRKAVVTEEVTVTVTVRREELVIEREPLDEPAGEVAWADTESPDAAGPVEFVLHAEEPVVTKRVVPLERVRVQREVVVEERRISDEVRKERLDVDETSLQEEPHP